MKTERVKLTQITLNPDNPREISEKDFHNLINSILVLPKMLELRPVVTDEQLRALGGNMRSRALCEISGMSLDSIIDNLAQQPTFMKKGKGEQQVIIAYWQKWLETPTVTIVRAAELTADEQREFIIKDNVSFGKWDLDAIANQWDVKELNEWGINMMGLAMASSAPADGDAAATKGTGSGTGEKKAGYEHSVLVQCKSQEQQMELIAELTGRGHECEAY